MTTVNKESVKIIAETVILDFRVKCEDSKYHFALGSLNTMFQLGLLTANEFEKYKERLSIEKKAYELATETRDIAKEGEEEDLNSHKI